MKGTIIAATIATIALADPAAAQTPQGVTFPTARVAFFDSERVAAESVTGQTAFAVLDAFRTEAATELERRNRALATERKRLQAESAVLSAAARLDLERDRKSTRLNSSH